MTGFGQDAAICLGEEVIFVKSYKCPYRVKFDVDLCLRFSTSSAQTNRVTFQLDLDLDAGPSGDLLCTFGRDPAICLVEEAICAKCFQMNRQTDGRTTDDARLH